MTDLDTAPLSRLDGKIAIITGAAQGMGEETARLFATRGCAGLLLTDRNAEKGEAVAASLRERGTEARFVAADLSDPAAPEAIAAAADQTFGRVDILCNIAGHYGSGMYTELDVTPAR